MLGVGTEAEGLVRRAAELGAEIDPRAATDLLAFEALLLERAVPAGLVSATDAGRIRERHILDCLRALAGLRPDDTEVVDLGSGAGLPGLVVAIARPALRLRLVEPRRRRAAFLELALERVAVANASVIPTRAEEVGLLVARGLEPPADACLARALAPLDRCAVLARPILGPDGRLIWYAGRAWRSRARPPGAEVLPPVGLESAGPLVIMGRQ